MKKLLFSISLLTLIQCVPNEKNIQDEINTLRRRPEIFTIPHEYDVTIETQNGVKLTIPPNSLVYQDGRPVSGTVEIEISEVFNKSEMILNNLTTTSNDYPLISMGMVKIEARFKNEKLKISPGNVLILSIPNHSNSSEGELFYGKENEKGIDWEYAGSNRDTTELVTVSIPLSFGRDSVSRTTYRYENGRKILISTDSGASLYPDNVLTSDDSVDSVSDVPPLYEFGISKLGWINCDEFLNIESPTSLSVRVKNGNVYRAYIVFQELNSIMPLYLSSDGKYTSANLPSGMKVNIVVTGTNDENLMWVKHEFILGASRELSLELSPVSKENLEKELRKLDN